MNLADTGTGPRSTAGQPDEAFNRSLESLSRLLASRPAPPPLPETNPFAPGDEAATRRRGAAPAVLLLVAAIAAVSAGVYSFLQGAVAPPPRESHKVERVPAATVQPPTVTRPAPSIAAIVPPPADAAPVSAADLVPPTPVVSQPLDARGISELQTRLSRLGFSPGSIDGIAGPMTAAAIKRYQQSRGRPVAAAVDDDLLDQLRKESAR